MKKWKKMKNEKHVIRVKNTTKAREILYLAALLSQKKPKNCHTCPKTRIRAFFWINVPTFVLWRTIFLHSLIGASNISRNTRPQEASGTLNSTRHIFGTRAYHALSIRTNILPERLRTVPAHTHTPSTARFVLFDTSLPGIHILARAALFQNTYQYNNGTRMLLLYYYFTPTTARHHISHRHC